MEKIFVERNGRSTIAYRPSRQDVENLHVGDFAPNVFGEGKVTEIYAHGIDINGKSYVCYYSTWGPSGDSRISGSMKENEIVRTIALTAMLNSHEIDFLERN